MYDVLIIGGGIVGLGTAYQLKKNNQGLKIAILEKEKEVAKHQTGHNSGVIHSGLYYKPNSLKAQNCIRGYEMLLDFCKKEGIPFDLCGKIVVATSEEQLPQLENLYQRGLQNSLKEIKKLNSLAEIQEHEPYCTGKKGLFVPYTGIVNYKQVSEKYAEKIQIGGGEIFFNQKVIKITQGLSVCIVETERQSFETKLIVNCAGLYSDKVAQLTQKERLNLQIIPFRGEYYELKPSKQHLVKNLIYPVPDPNFPFLGVHFTRMIQGGVEAGPNAVLAFSREGYTKSSIDFKELFETLRFKGFQKVAAKYWEMGLSEMYRSFSKAAFTESLQTLVPDIQQEDLLSAEAGVRAQACDREGGLLDDFSIIESSKVINVCNAPSPAATSSLSIGQTIAEKIQMKLR